MKIEVCYDAIDVDTDLLLKPGANLATGQVELEKLVGPLSSVESDLLTLAAAIFAADLATRRGEREGFIREIEITVPVVNWHLFNSLNRDLVRILFFLSSDNWTVNFPRRSGVIGLAPPGADSDSYALLFSGGLDSLAAAMEYLSQDKSLHLVSHHTRNPVTIRSQTKLVNALSQLYPSKTQHYPVRVGGTNTADLPFPTDDDREPSQRTRSFLFLVLAAIVSRRRGTSEVLLIAENGQMAIHLPLTAARIGAFSTHTAHPQFVAQMQDFLRAVLEYPISIRNPFLYRTKSECVTSLVPSHVDLISDSVSCWRGSRQQSSHCGFCVPCFIRRIALEHHSVKINEYERDIFVEPVSTLMSDDQGKRNLVELIEFVFSWLHSADDDLLASYPEIINRHVDLNSAADMYRRFAGEAKAVFENYPHVMELFQ